MRPAVARTMAVGTLLLAAGAAWADGIAPGLWKVTTITIVNGAPTPPQVKTRCLSTAEAGDPGKTFSPEFGAVNASCERTQFNSTAQRLTWRLQCKGQIDMDVTADFNFESATRYLATIDTKGAMAGQLMMSSTAAIEGEHIGECR